MDVRHMTEIDLNGCLFMMYPDNLTMEESRERLEMEITLVAMEEDEERKARGECESDEEPAITPFWIQMVLYKRACEDAEKMTEAERRKTAEEMMLKILANRRKANS